MKDSFKKPKQLGKDQSDGGGDGSEPADAVLLATIGAGNSEAFWYFWSRHQKSLHQLCLRLMDGRASDAEDALSRVMLKAWDRLPSCAGRITHLEAWLRRLARNLCIDLRREHNRQTEVIESWAITTLTEPEISRPAPSSNLEGNSEIEERIAALPPMLREPFVLHIVREIPVPEAAAQLGLTPANLRKRVQLARAQLRRDIENDRTGKRDIQLLKKQPIAATPSSPNRPVPPSKPAECFPVAAFIRTVRVKLPCGVERLFHVFPSKAPFGLERRVKTFQSQVSQKPDDWKKRLELAELFHLTGNWNKAVGEWRQMLVVRPDLTAVLKLGDTLLKMGGIETAADLFRTVRRQDFHSAATTRHLDGWIALCQKNISQSAQEFQAAANLEPENPVHWHSLAVTDWLAGALPEALLAINCALKLNPNDLVALSLGHEMLLAAGDVEEASRRAQHLLKLAPLDLVTMRRLIDCRCQLKLIQGAAGLETVRLLRRTQRLSQNPLLMHETLAAFFLAQGKSQKALAVYREFAEAHPQCLHSRHNYSRLFAATGLSDRFPAEPGVWKSPTAKHCHGVCQGHEPIGLLRT
jgi:RNA polymerase sigma factor (sigma-70 family)